MKRKSHADPVPPELARYVLERDHGCVLAILALRGRIVLATSCRDRYGTPVDGRFVSSFERILTIAHVRDRAGGRLGKRPPSTPRRLAAICYGHHLSEALVDSAVVRPAVDAYLEEREGPDIDYSRPWERIRRVGARAIDS